MGSVITMTGAGSVAAWTLLNLIDVPQNGVLEGVCFSAMDDADADADQWTVNLTFASTPGAPSNDSRSSILYLTKQNQLVTSGMTQNSTYFYCKLPDIPVAVGERIFLHANLTSGVALTVVLGLHFSFNQSVPSSRR